MSQKRVTAMPKKSERLQIPSLGEWYADLLAVDARINDRSEPSQAQSLLCSKLQEREERIKARVHYLAEKRGISPAEMWKQLVTDAFTKITPEEWAEMPLEPKSGFEPPTDYKNLGQCIMHHLTKLVDSGKFPNGRLKELMGGAAPTEVEVLRIALICGLTEEYVSSLPLNGGAHAKSTSGAK